MYYIIILASHCFYDLSRVALHILKDVFLLLLVSYCSVGWAPAFILKRHVLSGIRDSPQEPFIADSVDFVVSQVMLSSVF